MVVHGVSMQFIGYAVGPAIAAQLLGFGYDVINTTAAILFVVAALLLLPGVMAQRESLRHDQFSAGSVGHPVCRTDHCVGRYTNLVVLAGS